MTRRGPRRWRIPLPALRLRHKLGISLSIAALLPVLVASWVAVSVVLRGLDIGLRDETGRQLEVGINLVLRNVERIGQVAVRLSSSKNLVRAMRRGDEEVESALAVEGAHLPSSLVQVADDTGTVVARRVVGGVGDRFRGLEVEDNSEPIRAGLSYERRVTIVTVDDVLVVRAAAPVVDASYMLQGVVVVSLPLDADFADGIKASLGADVLIVAGAEPDDGAAQTEGGARAGAMSTFLDRTGARVTSIAASPDIFSDVARGQTAFSHETILGRDYALGYAPLQNLAGDVIGVFSVAVDRAPLLEARSAATRSLVLGAAGAFVFALGLSGLLSRRITRPLGRLHRGARAIAQGDLSHRIEVHEGDEIGDLARAFSHMTRALKENQERLAARMREIVALHDAGRAVSSEIDLEQVLRKIVDQVARVLGVRLCALWLLEEGADADEPALRLGAARAKRSDMNMGERSDEVAEMARPLSAIAAEVAKTRRRIRIDRVSDDPERREAAVAARVTGALVALPLVGKRQVVGVLIIGRAVDAAPFSAADADLLAAFGDQAAAAIENARLYEAVRAFNEELEQKVRLRTAELTAINRELGRALEELRETQSQLILSERLAGLGQLVAGVAHEINSPSAAIRGSVDAMAGSVSRLAERSNELASLPLPTGEARGFLDAVAAAAERGARQPLASPTSVRRTARAVRGRLERAGLRGPGASAAAGELAELGLGAPGDDEEPGRKDEVVRRLVELASAAPEEHRDARLRVLVGYLAEYVYLQRSAATIQNAIRRVQRIVGALKSYSHLDQEASLVEADLHEGIDNTLVILDHQLARGITITRKYGKLPRVPVYVDELNQVWTNLLHNAVQALQGCGTIEIETETAEDGVIVRIADDGPGIPEDVMPRVFEPFYTTKAKGEGTGLGLGIVRQIVDKHGGRVSASSEPGSTRFEVWLPLEGPKGGGGGEDAPR